MLTIVLFVIFGVLVIASPFVVLLIAYYSAIRVVYDEENQALKLYDSPYEKFSPRNNLEIWAYVKGSIAPLSCICKVTEMCDVLGDTHIVWSIKLNEKYDVDNVLDHRKIVRIDSKYHSTNNTFKRLYFY